MVTSKLERNYTIPLRANFVKVPKYYRAKRAISCIKKYMEKHMKSEDVKIGPVLNEYVWSNGITNPPGKVTVKAIKEGDSVTVELEGHEYRVQKIQTEKTDKPTSFKDKLAAKLNQTKQGDSEEEQEEPKKESKEESKEVKAEVKEEKPKDDKKTKDSKEELSDVPSDEKPKEANSNNTKKESESK